MQISEKRASQHDWHFKEKGGSSYVWNGMIKQTSREK